MKSSVAGLLLLAGCAGAPPVHVANSLEACPDVSGTYCSRGLRWVRGDTELLSASLLWYLGIDEAGRDVDRVTIEGVVAGSMHIGVHAGPEAVIRADIASSALSCGEGRVLLKMDTLPWGDAFALALGGSSGWNLLSRTDDGALRVEQVRRHRGTVLVAIPVAIKEQAWARFEPVRDGVCAAP